MSHADPLGEFDAELDAINRYERMVEKQVRTIESIDDKAVAVARFVGLLFGLVLTGVSAVHELGSGLAVHSSGPVLAASVLGVSGLFVCVMFAVFTYLSSAFDYGPTKRLGGIMASYSVDDEEYKSVVLGGYHRAIETNEAVITTNARRFQRSLAGLLCGLLFVATAVGLVVVDATTGVEYGAVLASGGVAAAVSRYVVREEYLTVERERNSNE